MVDDKQVGILTFHDTINYGGVLQCLALQEVVSNLGFSPYVINYGLKAPPPSRRQIPRRILGQAIRMLNGPLGASKRRRRTQQFIRDKYKNISRKYETIEELEKFPPQGQTYIVGSDQVWNPQITGGDEAYVLNFGKVTTKRVAYAASIGVSKPGEDQRTALIQGLADFDYISVREGSAKVLLNGATRADIEVVLDPTLLLSAEQWLSRIEQVSSEKYLLVYMLPGDRAVERTVLDVARQVAQLQGLEIRVIGDREIKRILPKSNGIYGAGPQQFLDLVCGASFIVTNSFHGTAFATNLRVPFLSVIPQSENHPDSRSGRQISFLGAVGLNHRLIHDGEDTRILDLSSLPEREDLLRAESALLRLRRESTSWLNEALRA